jgi:hypothetical protein
MCGRANFHHLRRKMNKFRSLAVFLAVAIGGGTSFLYGVTLPYVNQGGYHTTLVLENPSSDGVAVPDFYRPIAIGGAAVSVDGYDTLRTADWPRAGMSVASFDVPAQLSAYVEIQTPLGSQFPVHESDLQFVAVGETYQAQNLRADGYSSFFGLFSDAQTSVETRCYDRALPLYSSIASFGGHPTPLHPAGTPGAASSACDTGTANRATLSVYAPVLSPVRDSQPFYALAVRRSLVTGEWIVLQLKRVVSR